MEKKQVPVKVKHTRASKQPKISKRPLQEVASIYAEESIQQAKRSRAGEEDEEDDGLVSDQEEPVPYTYSSGRKTPDNFEVVAGEVFQEFWRMEFEDHEVTAAFFARITALNCREYHLDNFAETSSNLGVIKVRRRAGLLLYLL